MEVCRIRHDRVVHRSDVVDVVRESFLPGTAFGFSFSGDLKKVFRGAATVGVTVGAWFLS